MKTVYVADDGTQFDDEYDCEQYELRKSLQLMDFSALNFQGDPITKEQKVSGDDWWYFYTNTSEDLKKIIAHFHKLGITTRGIKEPDYYMYVGSTDQWKSIKEEIQQRQVEIDRFQKYINLLSNNMLN